MTGPWTSTTAGPECLAGLATVLIPWDYPHSTLDATKVKRDKKQGTRMVKVECGECGYTLRTTKKWLVERGTPLCPCNNERMKGPEPEDADEPEESGEERLAA